MKQFNSLSQARWVRWLRRPRSLQWKIMALVGLTYLVTLVLILALVVTSIRRAEASAWLSRQTEAAHNAGDTVAGFLQHTEDTLSLMSLLGRDELAAQPEVIRQVLQYNPALLEIVALDATGRVIADASQDRAVLANLFTIPQSQWFATAKAGQPYFGGVRISSGDEPYLIVALPAIDGGVVATRLKMDVLWDVVGNIRFGKAGHAYVVDQTGNVIAHTDPDVVQAQTNLAERPEILNTLSAADRQWSGEYRNFDGADVVGVTGPIGRTEWTIVTELPQAEAYQSSRTAIVLIGGGMLLISSVMIWLLRRNLQRLVFRPMVQLQTGAECIGQGDLSHRIHLTQRDEIGRVAQAFDDMAEHLQQRDGQLAEQNAALAAEVQERQRAEETLYASEMHLRRITDNMRDVISEIDAQGNILYASSSHLWVLGCRPEEVLGQPIYARLHPDDATAAVLGLAEALATKSAPEAVTFRYRHEDGHYVWMECTATLLYDEAGEPNGAILSSRDVTQRKSVENSLRDSEARYRAIVEDQTELICRWQTDGTLTFVNEAYCRYFKRTRDELIGHSFIPLIPEEDHKTIEQATASISLDHPVSMYEHRVILADGSLRWQQWTDRAIFDAQDQLIEFASVGRDITEHKQAEDALRTSEERLRMALKASRMLAWDFDVQTSTLLLSDNVAEIWDGPINGLEDTLGILHPEDRQAMLDFWTNALAQGGEHLTQFRVVLPVSGAIRWMEARGRVTQSAGAPRVGGVIFDITERKEAEEEIKRLNASLEQRVIERTTQLREAEAKYRLLVEQIPAVMYVSVDVEGGTQYISPQVEALLGYPPAVWQADPALWVNVLHPDDHDRVLAHVGQCAAQGEPYHHEYRLIARDGHTVWVRDDAQLVRDQVSRPLHWQGIMYDITEHKRAELRSTIFASLAQRLNATSSPQEAAHIILDVARSLAGWDACFIDLYSPDKDLILYNVLMMDTVNGQVVELPVPDTNYTPTPVVRRTIDEGGQLLLLHDWDTEHGELVSFGEGEQQTISLMFVPIRHGARVIGVLSIQSYAPDAYDQNDLNTLQSLADHCGAALERIQAADQIHASLREKEVLLKEIHHRVKNNLQVISSLLSLQSRQVTDVTTLELLRESQNRVRSMALIHEKLYQSDDLARVDFAEYVRNLAMYLFRSYKASPAAVSLSIETAPDLRLSLDAAIPCGLIVNELVSNALKHAFPDGRAGEICVSFDHAGDGQYQLQVSDNGVGLPAGFDWRQSNSLGLQLVNTLIEQLDGTIEVRRNGGTEFAARFSDVRR